MVLLMYHQVRCTQVHRINLFDPDGSAGGSGPAIASAKIGSPHDDYEDWSPVLKEFRAAPNLLTFLRLCLIPFLLIAVLDSHYRTALFLFVVAGLSDGLDGFAARLLEQQTQLGQYLDPVADKLLLSTLFLVLTHQQLVSLRITVLVFSRDLGILIVATLLYIALGIRDFRPSIYGKASTCAQIVTLVSVLLCQFYAPRPLILVRGGALDATVVLTMVSAFHYAWRTARRLAITEQAVL